MNTSPYHNVPVSNWLRKTEELLSMHPLNKKAIVDIVLNAWNDIFNSKIGSRQYVIGRDFFPKPQIMGFLLHELIPIELSVKYPNKWRPEQDAADKDLVYIPDNKFSIEIKASSSKGKIYGNRSYAQETKKGKKDKSGYYLAINFKDFDRKTVKQKNTIVTRPEIILIRFGWLDHSDWMGQVAPSGQQSRLSSDVENYKLGTLYSVSKE